jgi:hypothetical protein
MEQENWLKIDEYSDYSISNFGNVRNDKTNRILKLFQKNDKEYLNVNLCKNSKLKGMRVHRLVALAFIPNPNNKEFIDHIDGNKTNNHISNLRWVTPKENQYNRPISKSNTSGIKGVSLCKSTQKWVCQIKINGKSTHLGCFVNLDDAIKKRQEVAKQQFGEFINICELLH